MGADAGRSSRSGCRLGLGTDSATSSFCGGQPMLRWLPCMLAKGSMAQPGETNQAAEWKRLAALSAARAPEPASKRLKFGGGSAHQRTGDLKA